MRLLTKRDMRLHAESSRPLWHQKRCYFYNSFFMAKLVNGAEQNYNYDGVLRWTRKKSSIFDGRAVFVPINVGNTHWILIVIDFAKKCVRCYDSGVKNAELSATYIAFIMRWLKDEHSARYKTQLDTASWSSVKSTENTPREAVPQKGDCRVSVRKWPQSPLCCPGAKSVITAAVYSCCFSRLTSPLACIQRPPSRTLCPFGLGFRLIS
jgi:Ulp1 family protease